MTKHTVRFLPNNVEIEVDSGVSLLEVANKAGIAIKSTCGGDGSCGRCTVKVQEGQVTSIGQGNLSKKAKEQGLSLACKSIVSENVSIEVPKDSLLQSHQILLEDKNLLS
ncbi:MAG: 2Fe-2S iron-sulfur cluster-binding protein, partial [Bacillota bacterium]|nr:2Fe-2S iron-sulfur cluster-binding protein [Bacillota bacterium]